MPRQPSVSALILLVFLAGCAGLPPAPGPVGVRDAFHLVGRVSVRQGEQGFSGTLEWWHRQASDGVEILGPLGKGVARLERGADGVLLFTADGQVHRAPDVESLTETVLGWPLPLSRLVYWVQGQPHPGSASTLARDAGGRPSVLVQDGWRIEYSAWQAVNGSALPSRLSVEGRDLRLKLAVDAWEIP